MLIFIIIINRLKIIKIYISKITIKIRIYLFTEETELAILSFAQNSYVGTFQENTLQLPLITLLDNSRQVNLTIAGGNYVNVFK